MSSPAQTPGPARRRFAFDEFELDLDAFELRRDGIPLALEPQVIEVLSVLVERAGNVVTKDEIFNRVWPERYVSEAALNSRVMSARKALGDSGQQQRYIKTVHGRGYRFLGVVNEPRPSVLIPFPAREGRAYRPAPAATSFIGRSEELASLRELLGRDECRLLTVCGPGGAGKTRVLIEMHEARADGGESWFISLEHAGPGTLAASIACGIGAQAGSGSAEDQILRAVGNRAVTLYLDNIEPLVGEARALFARLLDDAPGLRIVCTSRAALSIQREWLFRLDGMTAGDAALLFAARSTRARSGRPLVADDASVAAICELTGYLPLAVELAAGLTAYLEPEAILEQIRSDAAALATSMHDVPDRHRSLAALFEESCSRLTEADREALTVCAVFAGPFDARAAAAVASCHLRDLRPLVDGSLLQANSGRFSMHPLLRQLALAGAGSELEDLLAAHGEYFMRRLADAAPELEGANQLAAVDAVADDFSNVSAAWRWSVAAGRVDLIAAAQRGLFAYMVRGHYTEGDALAELATVAVRNAGDNASLAGLLVSRAWFLFRLGQMGEASAALNEAADLGRELNLPWRPGYGADYRLALAMFLLGAGDYPRAFAQAHAARALALDASDHPGTAYACWIAGMALLRQSRLICDESDGKVRYRAADGDTLVAESAAYIAEAQSLLPEGEHFLTASVSVEAALHHEYLGRVDAAQACFRRAYDLRRALGDLRGMGHARFNLAGALLNDGRAREAEDLLAEAEELFRRLGDASGMAEITRVRALARLAVGDLFGAREALVDSLRRSLALGFANNIAGLMRTFAELLGVEGDLQRSADVFHAVAADPSTTPASIARTDAALARLAAQGVRPSGAAATARELAAEVVREADLGLFHEPEKAPV